MCQLLIWYSFFFYKMEWCTCRILITNFPTSKRCNIWDFFFFWLFLSGLCWRIAFTGLKDVIPLMPAYFSGSTIDESCPWYSRLWGFSWSKAWKELYPKWDVSDDRSSCSMCSAFSREETSNESGSFAVYDLNIPLISWEKICLLFLLVCNLLSPTDCKCGTHLLTIQIPNNLYT